MNDYNEWKFCITDLDASLESNEKFITKRRPRELASSNTITNGRLHNHQFSSVKSTKDTQITKCPFITLNL